MSPAAARRPTRSSLERKLPLLISVLLAAVLLAYGGAAYREVRQSATVAASARLGRVARELADVSAISLARQGARLRPTAGNRSMAAALTGAAPAGPAADVLREAAPRSDSTLEALELWSSRGVRWATVGAPLTTMDSTVLRRTMHASGPGDSLAVSPLYAARGHVYMWIIVPVDAHHARIGYVAERRRIANASRAGQQIRALTGQDVTVWFTSAGSQTWAGLRGAPLAAPFDLSRLGPNFTTSAHGRRVLGAQATVTGTPWTIVLTVPERAVARPALVFLNRMLAIGVLLLVGAAAAAWALSRHVTRPLREMTEAAEAVAAGRFDRSVTVTRDDELGRLASTFNAMAHRVSESHRELARRVDQSTALADALETRNVELGAAQRETLRTARRIERLQAVTAALAGAIAVDHVSAIIVEHGLAAAGAHSGAIFLLDPERTTLRRLHGEAGPALTPTREPSFSLGAHRPVADAARTGEPQFLATAEEWTARYQSLAPRGPSDSRAWAALPLVVGDRTIGAMGLSFPEPQRFDRSTREFLLALAQQCAQAIDRALLFDTAVHARAAAEEARRSAQAANEAKSSFLAMMSHELRTPLNAIGGYAELLELGIRGPITAAQRDDLVRIRRSQRHLLSIIEEILTLSRIEAGQLAIELSDFRVRDVLEDVEALVAPQMAAKSIRYHPPECEPDIVVHADREKLLQVLLNLLSNAMRFTDAGGMVSLSCEPGTVGSPPRPPRRHRNRDSARQTPGDLRAVRAGGRWPHAPRGRNGTRTRDQP